MHRAANKYLHILDITVHCTVIVYIVQVEDDIPVCETIVDEKCEDFTSGLIHSFIYPLIVLLSNL